MYEYWYIIILCVILGIVAYIRIRYPFWSIQPVYHPYDIWRYFATTPFVINPRIPIKTKFYDNKHIETIDFEDIHEIQLKKMVDLLQCYYLKSDTVLYTLDTESIKTNCIGHSHPCYISFYNEIEYADTSILTHDISTQVQPLGFMISRPCMFYLRQEKSSIPIYFWDSICIHREYRSKNLDRNLFQTHEYNQRVRNPDIFASLLKKEEPLYKGIVPLIEFNSQIFLLNRLEKTSGLPPHHIVYHMDPKNITEIYEFLEERNAQTEFSIFPEIGSILSWIKANRCFVYILKCKDLILGVYFFRNSNMLYEEGGYVLECISTIWNPEAYPHFHDSIKQKLFFIGFLKALRNAAEQGRNDKIQYRFLKMNGMGDTLQILDLWTKKYAPLSNTKTAYYIYNMVIPGMPFSNRNGFFLL